MRDRKPFKLERTLLVYNFFQVALSVWMVYEGFVIWQYYSWRCQPVDWSRTPKAYREARVVYVYYLAKITELLDTIFFVLRKNDRQVTFLHVYHHTVMPMISWGSTKYYPGGHGTFIGWINSFVHIIMYSYYFLSAFGPQMQKYLWWKKHITNLQMVGSSAILYMSSIYISIFCLSTDPVLLRLHSSDSAALHRLRLPQMVCLLHPAQCRVLLLPVQ